MQRNKQQFRKHTNMFRVILRNTPKLRAQKTPAKECLAKPQAEVHGDEVMGAAGRWESELQEAATAKSPAGVFVARPTTWNFQKKSSYIHIIRVSSSCNIFFRKIPSRTNYVKLRKESRLHVICIVSSSCNKKKCSKIPSRSLCSAANSVKLQKEES